MGIVYTIFWVVVAAINFFGLICNIQTGNVVLGTISAIAVIVSLYCARESGDE